ncbi:ATP-binding protein [Terrimonas sp. NA20]|uniref:ATP-binding protein n=1 Tax=Terrimonas ginsenosidimutans TaxID=2908004 RepID=A0ABS9KUP1_9BACT|nr:ATP-binding protein [Terrimonas ginsenosidimutans]MCG2616028.1 ATP-binding protein [Terrimonas ginsenosidimutans]
MRALSHIGRIRSRLLLLCLFTLVCLAGLLKAISYNSQKEEEGGIALMQANKVMRNLEGLRAAVSETESLVQSFLLTGDQQWKKELPASRLVMLQLLKETASLEADQMQQQKFALIKKSIEQKIAFQENMLRMDNISPAYLEAIGYHQINGRLDEKIRLPILLATERQALLMQRKAAENDSASMHARFITIFTAVFIYLLILCALWHLRNLVRTGPAARMDNTDTEDDEIFSREQGAFIGVFSIAGSGQIIRRQEGTAIVRVLWAKEEVEQNFNYIAAKIDEQQKSLKKGSSDEETELMEEDLLPEWMAAGLPEQLTLNVDRGHDHFMGQAVNANYYQPGPVYNRQPGNYMPGGMSSYRILPVPPTPNQPEITRTPGQESPGFELSTLIQDILNPYYVEAEEKNIRLLYTLDPSIPNFLSGDARKLSGILRNVIDNAMRFTYKGYIQLTVTGMNIQVDKAEIAFSIADTGKGLDAEQMNDLLNGPGTTVPGLYQAKKLAESQQSQLMIHSTEEDGTVCCFVGSYRY